MSPTKLIAVIVLVVIGAHLLMFGYLRRVVARAIQEQKDRMERQEDSPRDDA